MREPRVVWAEPNDIADVLDGEVYATVYASPTHPTLAEAVLVKADAFLLLPIERDEDGAVSVKVGDLTVRYLNNDQRLRIPHVAHPEDSSHANNVHRLARLLIETADKATAPGDDHA